MHLHLFMFGLIFLGERDLVLHLDLLLVVLLLHLSEFADSEDFGLMTGQSLTHGQLVLILRLLRSVLLN